MEKWMSMDGNPIYNWYLNASKNRGGPTTSVEAFHFSQELGHVEAHLQTEPSTWINLSDPPAMAEIWGVHQPS